jgi:pyruvate formate lyase activating enzyme
VTAVLYLGGCNLRCPTCPVPHLIGWGRAQGAIPFDSILDGVYRRRRWLDGVVVKGGEPFAQPDLAGLLEILKDFGLAVRIDCNGTCPDALRSAVRAGLADYVSVDLKAPLDERYHRAAGVRVDLGSLYRTIEFLLSGEVEYEFRTAVREGSPTESDVLSVARTIRGARRFALRAVPGRGPSRAALLRLARLAGPHVRCCTVDGRVEEVSASPAIAVRKIERNGE